MPTDSFAAKWMLALAPSQPYVHHNAPGLEPRVEHDVGHALQYTPVSKDISTTADSSIVANGRSELV